MQYRPWLRSNSWGTKAAAGSISTDRHEIPDSAPSLQRSLIEDKENAQDFGHSSRSQAQIIREAFCLGVTKNMNLNKCTRNHGNKVECMWNDPIVVGSRLQLRWRSRMRVRLTDSGGTAGVVVSIVPTPESGTEYRARIALGVHRGRKPNMPAQWMPNNAIMSRTECAQSATYSPTTSRSVCAWRDDPPREEKVTGEVVVPSMSPHTLSPQTMGPKRRSHSSPRCSYSWALETRWMEDRREKDKGVNPTSWGCGLATDTRAWGEIGASEQGGRMKESHDAAGSARMGTDWKRRYGGRPERTAMKGMTANMESGGRRDGNSSERKIVSAGRAGVDGARGVGMDKGDFEGESAQDVGK
ncbi:hypothetical protein DFH09DRAFT_1289277 [Mycena vulgaris]|nr:hypothetical protein DFH09DRAFT_1289277 [Mycena vulgaris]